MRTLAIDFGTRRIGLALSDAGGKWATPHAVLQVSDALLAIPQIVTLVQTESVRRLVVGLPLNMDESIGPSARRAIDWATRLLAAVGPDVSLVYVDERLSSFAAEQQLNSRRRGGERLTRQAKKSRLDAIAAAGFLQEFLDGKLPPVAIPIQRL
jgi:putative Holliday junction resolvase